MVFTSTADRTLNLKIPTHYHSARGRKVDEIYLSIEDLKLIAVADQAPSQALGVMRSRARASTGTPSLSLNMIY